MISDVHRQMLHRGLRDRPGPHIRLAVVEFPSFWPVNLAWKIEYLHDNEGKSSSELLWSTQTGRLRGQGHIQDTALQVDGASEEVLVLFIALRTTLQLDRH